MLRRHSEKDSWTRALSGWDGLVWDALDSDLDSACRNLAVMICLPPPPEPDKDILMTVPLRKHALT